jgi:hypothetical protein
MDYLGNSWVIDLLEEGYSGSVEEVKAGGQPMDITTLGEGDDESGIKAREWYIEFNNYTSFQFISLFTGTARDYLCEIYKNSTLVGSGWLDPDNYFEEFLPPVYPSRIHIHDGLGELRNVYFSMPDNPGGAFNRSVIYYLHRALSQTELDLPIHIATDITFERSTGDVVSSRIFESLFLDWRIFRLGEDSWWNYYDILTYILKSFEGHRLFQEAGAWVIERAGVMKTAQYDVDQYSSSGEFVASVKKTSIMALTSNSVALPLRFDSDAELSIVPAWKRYTLAQEYGVKDNILKARSLWGKIFADDWRTDDDIWYWTRTGVTIVNEDNAMRIVGFVKDEDLDPQFEKFIQSESVRITGSDIITLMRESWRKGYVLMRFTFEYFLRNRSYISSEESLRVFASVSLADDDGKVWNCFNNYDDVATGEHIVNPDYAWFDPAGNDPGVIIELIPQVNEWAIASFSIPVPMLRNISNPYLPGWWEFFVKFYPAVSSLDTGDDDDGLVIRSVKLGWIDEREDYKEGKREITEELEVKNRYVPNPIEVRFGETPGHWGEGSDARGQEQMDLYVFFDQDGVYVSDYGTKSAGIMGGLLKSVMTLSLNLKHHRPCFKIRGTLRDNPDAMDFTSTLQDYDGRHYFPTGMNRYSGDNEVNAEWVEIKTGKPLLAEDFTPLLNEDGQPLYS